MSIPNNSTLIQNIIDLANTLPDRQNLSGSVTPDKMLDGYTAYANNEKVVGNIPTNTEEDLVVNGATVVAPKGYYDTDTSGNVKEIEMNEPVIDMNSSNYTITATITQEEDGYVERSTKSSNLVAFAVSEGSTFTPGTSDVVIANTDTGFVGSDIIVKGDSSLTAANIRSGVKIFNVTGTKEDDSWPNGRSWSYSNISNYGIQFIFNPDQNIWVATSGGNIYYSTDGINWQLGISNSSCTCLYYANNMWIASGGLELYYSTNGMVWERCNITLDLAINTVRYSNGIWVAGTTYVAYPWEYDSSGLWYSTDGINWFLSTCVNSNYHSSGFDYLEFNNNVWVAASSNYNSSVGGVFYSTDGMTWTKYKIKYATKKLVYANNMYVGSLVSISGYGLCYSTDGMTWTQSNITDGSFDCIYYGNGIWIALSSDSVYGNIDFGIWYSTDGMTWESLTTATNVAGSYPTLLNYIESFNIWIMDTGDGLYYSTDGMTWALTNTGEKNFRRSFFVNNMCFVSSDSELWYSTDGISWTKVQNINFLIDNIYYYNNKYYLSSTSNGIYYSIDVMTWNQTNITSGNFISLYNANGLWVAGGNSLGLYYSTDGMTWNQTNITSGGFSCIYNANGVWVACNRDYNSNSGGLYYSTDGMTWTQSNITIGSFKTLYNANGIWVAGCISRGLYYSTDGMTWTQSNITDRSFDCIYYGNGLWVASSNNNGLYYSTDGMTWTQSNITIGSFNTIYNANGIWVAGGDNATGLYYSTDGMTWTQSNITSGFVSIVYNANGLWIACGVTGSIYYSIDGIIWETDNVQLEGVSIYYANGIWIVGGRTVYSSNGRGIYYSTDGRTWKQSKFEHCDNVYYANGIWVANCRNGCIYYSIGWALDES